VTVRRLVAAALCVVGAVGMSGCGFVPTLSSDQPGASGANGSGTITQGGPVVTVPTGIVTRMTPSQVISLAKTTLSTMSNGVANAIPIAIVSVTATGEAGLSSIEPGAGADLGGDRAGSIIWVVRATGTFVAPRSLPGKAPIVASSGYLLIDDATGESIGMGMP
jgi:hypothetical protein